MLMEPVEMDSIGAMAPRWPRRMIEPLPNCFLNLSDGDVDGFGAFLQVVERHAVSLALAVS